MGKGAGRGALDQDEKYMAGCCLVFSVLLTSCFLLGYSFDTLAPRRYGIRYDKVTLHVEPDRVYESGRYHVGLGRRFIEFPRWALYLEYSNSADGGARNGPVEAWTNDGQEIELSVGFYYTLRKEGIQSMFFNHKQFNWENIVEDVGASALREVATRYTAGAFFTQRNVIQDAMVAELRSQLQDAYAIEVELVQFNFLAVRIPSDFEDAVEARVVVAQQVQTIAGPQRQSNLTQAEITFIGADADRQRRTVFAQAEAEALLVRARATADTLLSFATARGEALRNLTLALGWRDNSTSPTAAQQQATAKLLLRYLWYKTVQADPASGTQLFVNFPQSVLQV